MIDQNHIGILACPKCKKPLGSTDRCDACGLQFEEDDGTPILMARDIKCKVQFEFQSERSVIANDMLEETMQDPPVALDKDNIPYHLDRSHIHVIKKLPVDSKVLEIGCGGGQSRSWYQSNGFNYIGVDISKTRVAEWLREFGGPDYLCDAHFLPFCNEQFDIVYSAAVIEHLACPQLAVQEVARVLKPGGYFLGSVSFLEPWHDNSFYHMSSLGVLELLVQANLEAEYVWPARGYSGYHALFAMGGETTRALKLFGEMIYLLYRTEGRMKKLLRPLLKKQPVHDIYSRAKIAGATDWIARKPK